MKVALVHDYLKEYGGAERVLQTLHEMFPEAPIYTAFMTPGSSAAKAFSGAKIITSWADWLIRYKNLHSALRFLIPAIWESFDRQLANYDLVILSSSGYLTKPVRIPKQVRVICYCHTPSRFLYGYATQAEWQRYWPIRAYGYLVAHFLRLYDFLGAKRVDKFIANSKNVQKRIEKFYRRDSILIYPPVEVEQIKRNLLSNRSSPKAEYFLIVSRIVGTKGVELAMQAAQKLGVPLKIAGARAGLKFLSQDLEKYASKYVEFVGEVSEEEKVNLMAGAKAFLALAQDEDFGMTVVEAMAAGTPVVAFAGGGYLETVVEGQTGTFFEKYAVESLAEAMQRIGKMKITKEDCQKQAEKFSKEKFIQKMKELVNA